MSDYQGNIVIKNPATPTGPTAIGRAPGMWKLSEVLPFVRQGIWPNANIPGPDIYFPYVSLLLSTTSLGNANNNLFVDSSGAFNPISRNGNATQGSFTPYGASWSNFFNGGTDRLQVPVTTNMYLGTTYTIEAWAYYASSSFGARPIFNQMEPFQGGFAFLGIGIGTSGVISADYRPATSGTVTSITGPTVVPNTWFHIALVCNSSSARLYINGTQVGSTTTFGDYPSAKTNTVAVGSWGSGWNDGGIPAAAWIGYISNMRVVKGTAVYTSNFTPSTAPLTAISGTVLLTCQSNRFIDNSSVNNTLTPVGNTAVTEFSPFAPAYPGISYNQSDIQYWSGYFDGSGDYLTLSGGVTNNGTGDLCLEFWSFYTGSYSGEAVAFDSRTSPFTNGFAVTAANSSGNWTMNFTVQDILTSTPVARNQWQHVAVTRSGNTFRLFVDGVLRGTLTSSNNLSSTTNVIGSSYNYGSNWPGYISNLRAIKGSIPTAYQTSSTTVGTSVFTPPTTPLTAISGTSLLTCQSAAFTDNSTNNFAVTINGNTTVTGNSPFNPVGFWSVQFNGSSNWLAASANTATTLGTGNFTIEGWFFTISTAANQILIEQAVIDEGSGNNQGWLLYVGTSGNLIFGSAGGATYINASPATSFLGKWTHFALVRTSTTSITLYVNGVSIGSTSTNVNMNMALDVRADTPTVMGSHELQLAGSFFNGYLSNFRIVKGTAVYTSNFTPPTAPLTAISGTGLLTLQSSRLVDNSGNNITVASTFSSYSGGSPAVQSFDPFYTSTMATNGGSLYVDGAGDHLAIPAVPMFNIGAADASVEMWVYSFNTNNVSLNGQNGGSNSTIRLLQFGGVYAFTINNDTVRSTSISITPNCWVHLVVTITGGIARMFVNGVLRFYGTGFGSVAARSDIYYIGGEEGIADWLTGYISDFRFNNGAIPTAYQTSTVTTGTSVFTPPTSPLTPTANTVLLVNGMNAGAYDATAINDMETVGDAKVSTAVSKFGGSSVYFDGSGDNLFMPSAPSMNFGTGNWTIECWVYVSTRTTNYPLIFGNNRGSFTTDALALTASNSDSASYNDKFVFAWGSAGFSSPSAGNSILLVSNVTNSTGTWYHLALVRDSSTSIKMFRNGTQVANATISSSATFNWGFNGTFTGGGNWDGAQGYFNGYIDDLRVTNGVARYTTTFTPPTQAFPTY